MVLYNVLYARNKLTGPFRKGNWVAFMIENVTYSADTGQQYTLVSHAQERCVINNMASACYMVSEWATKSNKSLH